MKKRKQKQSRRPNGVTRFYYPMTSRPTAIMGNEQMDLNPEAVGINMLKSDSDPNGSYTGYPVDGGAPTQDADDL